MYETSNMVIINMASLEHPLSKQLLYCSVCDRSFKYQSKLARHLLVHSKAKLYKCNYCDSAFSLSHNLKVHMRIHQGIKPYKCSFSGCEKVFTQSNNMRAHLKTHKFKSGMKIIFSLEKPKEHVDTKCILEDNLHEDKIKEEGSELEFEFETDLSESSFNF